MKATHSLKGTIRIEEGNLHRLRFPATFAVSTQTSEDRRRCCGQTSTDPKPQTRQWSTKTSRKTSRNLYNSTFSSGFQFPISRVLKLQHLLVQVAEQDCPHLLFYGPSGSGKKTLIIALIRQIFGPSADKVPHFSYFFFLVLHLSVRTISFGSEGLNYLFVCIWILSVLTKCLPTNDMFEE